MTQQLTGMVFPILYYVLVGYGYPLFVMKYKKKIIKIKYQFHLSILMLWAVLPTVLVIWLERKPFVFMGLYVPSLLYGVVATIVAFFVLSSFVLMEATYRVYWLGKKVEDAAPVPKNILTELLNQLVFAGLPEEFLSRGFLLAILSSIVGNSTGILASSLFFGLGHLVVSPSGDIYKALQTFGSGIVYGIMFISVGLIPCIITHISLNLFSGKLVRKILSRV